MGAMSHLAMALPNRAGLQGVHVPYRGSAPAVVHSIAGRVQLQLAMNNTVPTLPHVKSGWVCAVGVSGPLRSQVLPDAPTMAEAGAPGYEALQQYGVLLPVKVSKTIAHHQEISEVLRIPQVRTRLTEEGGDGVGGTPEQVSAFTGLETAKWAGVVQAKGVTAE